MKTIGLQRRIQNAKKNFNETINCMLSQNLELEFHEEEFLDDFRDFEEDAKNGDYCFYEFLSDLENSTNFDVKIHKNRNFSER